MRKFFTFKISDEPYKTTTSLNKTVDAIYEGPKFLALCVHTPTGEIRYISRSGETEDELQMSNLIDDDPDTEFVVLDASENTFEAAYLTGNYTHDPIPDYTEVLASGETWNYSFSGGGITQNYYGQDMLYLNGEFGTPRFREHAVTKASVIQGAKNLLAMITTSLSANDYNESERQELENYKNWLMTIETVYADVDHWKIPFPANPPHIY
jgi:hypothetical protein